MNINATVIGAVIGLAVLAGGAFVVVNSGDSEDSDSDQANTTQASTETIAGLRNIRFEGPYRVTIETTNAEGTQTTGSIDVDAEGDLQTTIINEGQQAGFIYLSNGDTFSQNPEDNSWIKFPNTASAVDLSNVNLGFTQQDLDEAAQDASLIDKGTGSCSAGTCRIFESTDEDGAVGILKVDESNKRISDVEVTSASGEKSNITYDYTVDVDVVAPEGATEFSIPNINLDDLPS